MERVERRTFFKIGGAVTTGIITHILIYPLKLEASKKVQDITKHPTDNAYYVEKYEDCSNNGIDVQECFKEFESSALDKINGVLIWPVTEELIFRVWPSAAIHNITYKGINLRVIPVPQLISFFYYWYLQRKFGIFSNTASHMLNNFRTLP